MRKRKVTNKIKWYILIAVALFLGIIIGYFTTNTLSAIGMPTTPLTEMQSIVISNIWWYNDNPDQTYSDVSVTGITKATAFSDFYDSGFQVYAGSSPWDFGSVWVKNSNAYPTLKWTTDSDGDGRLDYIDNIFGDERSVTQIGITNLRIVIGEIGATNEAYSGVHNIKFYDGTTKLFNFDFNFSAGVLDLSMVTIKKANNYLLVNLNNQLQSGYTKTMYLTNSDFTKLCVEDKEMTDISEVSTNCTSVGELDFTSCLSENNKTLNGIVCVYDNNAKVIAISNLTHTGIIGTITSTTTHTRGGGGGGSTHHDTNTADTNIIDTNHIDTNQNTNPDTNLAIISTDKNTTQPVIESPVVTDNNQSEQPIKEQSWFNKIINNKTVRYSVAGLLVLIIFSIIIIKIAKKKPEEPTITEITEQKLG